MIFFYISGADPIDILSLTVQKEILERDLARKILDNEKITIHNAPRKSRNIYQQRESTLAITDGTEIKIQKPSSLHAQSQSYSNYKSTNTLKALVAVDPRGSLLFTSCLFSGAISDKDIFEQSGLKKMLQNLVQHGHIKEGDGIMADKGFNIHKEVEDCKLKLNIPPFANAGLQMTQADALLTKKIAAHRVHVERTIGSVKKFKIVGQKVTLSLFGHVNQIWNV
ncbi:Hypothetical predicted protein [Mytilus galloprovincialis]|uniref:DDE Tnp4 domain-containing protein n=1 Tax=Mytilus galloprovincialis TaxID=29158 RepID=A0A8B6EQC2_MYTGA|nr:Hypothetical predicted protein [Mytilus galloprovincialis]